MNQSPKKRSEPAKKIGGGSLPLATASSPMAAASSATPSNGGHPRNAPGKWKTTTLGEITEWSNVYLEDVADDVTVGFVGSMIQEYQDTGIPFLRSQNVEQLEINLKDLKFINKEFHSKIIKSRLRPGDVVIVRTGKPGACAVIPDSIQEANCSDIVIVRCGKKLNNHFLAYYVNTVAAQHVSAHLVGAVQQHFNVGAARKLLMRLPPIRTQERITSILRTFDDKIALNRRINQTLEAMAQALFQSWFVDFDPVKAKQQILEAGGTAREAELAAMQIISGKNPHQLKTFQQTQPQQYAELEHTAKLFPNRLVESELGPIPEGWAVKTLSQLIILIGGGTPKRSDPTYWNGDIPWYSVKDAPNGSDIFVIDTEEHITQKGLDQSSTRLLPKGSSIISARGTVGKLALVATPMCMNQSCYGVIGAEGIGVFYNYFNLNKSIADLQQKVHGAVFDTITTSTFETCSQPFPGVTLVNKFDSFVSPLLSKIESNVRSNLKLTKTRDFLLPKLLSGEIDVSSLEIV